MGRLIVFFLFFSSIFFCEDSHRPFWESTRSTPVKPPLKNNPIHGPLVVLDAGHGGEDHGARVSTLLEKKLALATTLKVMKNLENLGFRVLLTRSRDVFVPLLKRASFANKYRCAIFVSIHFNSAKSHQAHGIEIFYSDSAKPFRLKHSKSLANHVLSSMVKETKAKSRGIKPGNFAVVRETEMPAIIVEGGFMTNPAERALLSEGAYLDKLAIGIAEGIELYFKREGKTIVQTQKNRPRRESNARPAA